MFHGMFHEINFIEKCWKAFIHAGFERNFLKNILLTPYRGYRGEVEDASRGCRL